MAATDINFFTIIVPNPEFDNSQSANVVNYSISYNLGLTNGFQTVSQNNPNSYVEGLLYVPTLTDPTDCANSSVVTIPSNVTTESSFPSNHHYPLFALFPWGSSNSCAQAYLNAAGADNANGAIIYQENNQPPPSGGDNSWNLLDKGSLSNNWKSQAQFPVYAVQASVASQLVQQLSLYSGNMSSAPSGNLLVKQFNPHDFPRIYVRADLQTGSGVPSLWIFLIIVLAVLLGVVIAASIGMHLIQRRQRSRLQRRVERGEVDLESLGIKRMNVPQTQIDQMPKWVFTSAASGSDHSTSKDGNNPIETSAASSQRANEFSATSQPTCPICLDDFVSGETSVRELPCKHIFHPECIDPFLRDNSSLCPMCKKSALPPGYTNVKVTNLMVRRERLVRRMRERRRNNLEANMRYAQRRRMQEARRSTAADTNNNPGMIGRLRNTLNINKRMSGTSATAPPVLPRNDSNGPPEPEHGDVELTAGVMEAADQPAAASRNVRRDTVAIPDDVARQGVAARRAWRRERLARAQQQSYDEQAENARVADEGRPLWRRMASRFMPGLD